MVVLVSVVVSVEPTQPPCDVDAQLAEPETVTVEAGIVYVEKAGHVDAGTVTTAVVVETGRHPDGRCDVELSNVSLEHGVDVIRRG